MNDELILSIDLGTTNLKSAVFDLKGNEIASEHVEYSLYTPENHIVENNVTYYWDYLVNIIKKITSSIGNKSKNIMAISTSSQGETIVPIGNNGVPLRNAIVWIDTRTVSEAEEIRQNFDIKKMYKKTGCPDVDPSWPATRILWFKKNQSDIFRETYKFLLLEDYIVYKLTGKFFGEASVYSSSYYYDIIDFDYIDEILEFIGIRKNKLPEIVMPGSIVSNVDPSIARYLGLNKNVKVVIGAMDQICGAVGAGNTESGIVTETTGSAFAMVVTTDKPVIEEEYNLPCIPHAVKDLYTLMPYSSTGGMVLKWFKDKFCTEETKIISKKQNIFKILDEMAKKISPGSEGLIMLPFITGAFFPEFNAAARGVYFGFGINHNKSHFIRAILESIGYMMRKDLNIMNEMGIKINEIISTGGGASSKLWSQIKADICNRSIKVPEYKECALLGSAIIAATSMGFFTDVNQAIKHTLKIKEVFYPNEKNKQIYDISYNKYLNIYYNLRNIF
jgi:sugar (pentulose or hexulose) kinase